ncbi:MAG: hypothetical protein ACPG8F_06560 [Flavobacteriaceae bacterium]
MKQSIVLILGLLVGYLLVKKTIFSPPKKKDKKGFRKRYEARKKEKLDARDESLHQDR